MVATTPVDESELRGELADADQIRVVTPAAKVSKLDWLTGDEDEERAEARETAEVVAEAVGGEVDPTSHNTDAAMSTTRCECSSPTRSSSSRVLETTRRGAKMRHSRRP